MSKLKEIVEDSMIQYSGAVIQSRALVDIRDGLKPSARQIFYSMLTHKLTHKNAYKKTANAVGMAMADFYIHGDSSCEGIIMRAAQGFAMRYPLVEVKGNAGTLIESGNWAAMRYTESRLSKISDILFGDIDKETISDWRDSYDNSKQYPSVLPSKGFYNIVNGTQGISVGMASSIPQYNLKELNNALITLLNNKDASFEDLYCAPDFATGAILFNEVEVKESMRIGNGSACKLRSVVEFDQKERCFIVTEIPYGVYTNTICGQLEEIINSDNNPGIDRFNDLTGIHPLIKIYITKNANPDRLLKFLFKNTSLQSYFGINFTALKDGRFPKVFTWKEILQEHLSHERIIYRRGFEFDVKKIDSRIHIIDGLLICMASIDEVVQLIKSSGSTADASHALQSKFLLDEIQAKAVLDMKLSKLAHLEVKKLENERIELIKESERIHFILSNEEAMNNEIKKGLKEVADKYGDERRTKILNIASNDDEPIEIKKLSLSFTNEGAMFVNETSTLYTQKRNGTGSKFKLDKNEYIVDSIVGDNTDTILFFTSHGNFYHKKLGEFAIDTKQYLSNFINLFPYEHIVSATLLSKNNTNKYIVFITKNGIIKKSELSEYNMKRNAGASAIKLDKDDEIVSVLFLNEEKISIASKEGNFIIIDTKNINAIGRVSRGVIGMKLGDKDSVVGARVIKSNDASIVIVSEEGMCKQISLDEFSTTGRGTKGVKISKERFADYIVLSKESDLIIVSTSSQIKIKSIEIPKLSRTAQGVKSIKLKENDKVIKIING